MSRKFKAFLLLLVLLNVLDLALTYVGLSLGAVETNVFWTRLNTHGIQFSDATLKLITTFFQVAMLIVSYNLSAIVPEHKKLLVGITWITMVAVVLFTGSSVLRNLAELNSVGWGRA